MYMHASVRAQNIFLMQYFIRTDILFQFINTINQEGLITDYTPDDESKWIILPPATFNGNDDFIAFVRDLRLDAWLYYYNL